MRRWLVRIFIGLAVLVVLTILVVQVVLWTDYPRRLVLRLVQQQLGLRVEAAGLSTGWFGNTVLRDVKLSLPLAEESFLTMPRMTLDHTSLLPLVLFRKFEVQAVELQRPDLLVRRDSAGRWNLQEVVDLVTRTAGGGTPAPGTKSRPPKLPRLQISGASIVIIERTGQTARIDPLTVKGYSEGPLVYRYDAEVPDKLKAVGQVAPGENFKHELRFFLQPREWLGPWVADAPAPLRINGQWTGLIDGGELAGRLVVEEAQAGVFGAQGRVAVQAGGPKQIVNPQGLVITTPIELMPKVQLASGTITADGPDVTLQQVRLAALGGQAQVDGTGNLVAKTADLNAIWQELVAPGQVRHSGNLQFTVRSPFPGRPQVSGTIVTRGKVPQGSWDGRLGVEGAGRTWSEMDWQLTVPRLAWSAKLPITIDNLAARVSNRGHLIRLTELTWPAAEQLSASAEFNARDNTWLARTRGRATLPPQQPGDAATPFDFNLDTYGNAERVHLNELFVRARGVDVRAVGDYVFTEPEPVAASVFITHDPSNLAADSDTVVRGKLLVEGHVRGTADPLKMAVTGTMRSDNLEAFGRPFGDIRGVVQGAVADNVARFTVRDLALLGGRWSVLGVWPYEEADKMSAADSLRVQVNVEDLALKDVGELLRTEGVGGTLAGEWKIDLTKPRRDLLAMAGTFRASGVVAKGFQADEVTGEMRLRNGQLRVAPIQFRRGDAGRATATVEATLATLANPHVTLSTEGWPVPLGANGSAALWADAELDIDGAKQGASGPIKARALIATTQRAIGEANVQVKLHGRIAALEQVNVTAVGGAAQGNAVINADAPNESQATLSWSGIQGERLSDLLPQLGGLTGTLNGAVTVDPAGSERALEPLRVRLQINPDAVKFRSVDVHPSKLSAFLDLGKNFRLNRIVLDQLPAEHREDQRREAELDAQNVPPQKRPLTWNDIRVADGRLRIWARRGQQPNGQVQSHIIANFARLDLDQLVHAFRPDAEPMPARLTGQVIVHGSANDRDAILGDGRLEITDSDLANSDILATLYNAMSLGTAPKEPNGKGSMQISLQRSVLTLDQVHYFNRGVEAWSSNLTIRNVWDAPQSPIEGYVVGSARPLSALKLPLLADVDQITSVLQQNLTTVRVDGTIAEPDPSMAAFSDVGGGLKQFLSGQVQESRGGR